MMDPARIDPTQEVRTLSFENPDAARGRAGQAGNGRKGSPSRMIAPGERIVLGEVEGPGRIRHFWLTLPPMPPEDMRRVRLEVFYDGANEPSISVPCLDFFGVLHGRPVAFASSLVAVQEGRGFNSWIPMPFRRGIRLELTNESDRRFPLYYQITLTLGPVADDVGILHATFRRENPTRLRRDFVIAEGLTGPGRFLGACVGVRVLPDPAFTWYGEGEVKMFIDDDDAFPTWCGTGLEDYVGTAWGMGPHHVPWQGSPLVIGPPDATMPEFVGFYRWHVPDPIAFRERLRVTLQQIGAVAVPRGDTEIRRTIEADGRTAGTGFHDIPEGPLEAFGICERRDDVCATAFVYCTDVQAVERVDMNRAAADIERRNWEEANPFEKALGLLFRG